MAVYTDVSFEELAEWLGAYDIGSPTSFKGIAEGVENSNFFLQTDRGHFVLTLYEKRVHAEDLPFFLGLMEHLAAYGIECPVPVRTRTGKQWTTLNGRPAAILTYLDGVSLRRPDVGHCAAAGLALANLHQAGRDFRLTRKNALSVSGWVRLAEATAARAGEISSELPTLIETGLARMTTYWPSDLPSGVIHADLFPDNVLFMGSRITGLIDFYFACNDAYVYDLAIMLNAWCFEQDGAYNVTKGRALITSYGRARALSTTEIEFLPLLCSGAALRFLLTRLYDWLNPDPTALVRPKDPREYARRLRFHMSVKSSTEYGL